MLMIEDIGCDMQGAIRRLRRQRPIMHCVGITAAVQQEVLSFMS